MLRRLWHIASLERRRLMFVTALAFCAGALFYSHVPAGPTAIPVPLATGLAYAVVVGPAALLTCVFMPAVRFMIEAIAVSRLLVAMVVFHFPDAALVLVTTPILMAALVVSGGAVISRLLHGRFLRQPSDRLAGLLPLGLFQRRSPVLVGNHWQHRFVGWMDQQNPLRG